ncbi:MAG TPA: hypothetical protein VGG25_26455 [Streptosporangiaceae bacterium]|jgi:hypothetical protein
MTASADRKMVVTPAPISGPGVAESYEAGRQAGEQDLQASLFEQGADVDISQVRRVVQESGDNHNLVAALVERDFEAPVADAQAAHEAAGHRLDRTVREAHDAALAVIAEVRVRDELRDRVVGLVNPELSGVAAGQSVAQPAGDATEAPPAFRHILERKVPRGWGYGVLVALAIAEGFLNLQAFTATGESSTGSLVLAVLVGIGVIGLSHRLGDCAADLLENRTRAKGRSPARLAELAVGIPALVIGILGTAAIRARYFSDQSQAHPGQHLSIPTWGLVALAFMLAAAAVTVSMAMRNPFADELTSRAAEIKDLRHAYEVAKDRLAAAQGAVSTTTAGLRTVLQRLITQYRIQTTHARKCSGAYLDGYCATARIKVTGELPAPEPLALAVAAQAWLDAHPLGTLAPPELPFSVATRLAPAPELAAPGPGASSAGDPAAGDPAAGLGPVYRIEQPQPASSNSHQET